MFSVNIDTTTSFSDNTKCHIYDVEAELISEICSFLEIHDQVNMKRVCKWWRINLSQTFLSRLVDIDTMRLSDQSEDFLEYTLSKRIQKNTKVLVLRHMFLTGNKMDLVTRVIKEKQAGIIQLTLRDCEVHKERASAAYWWTHPERITTKMMHSLIFATKKLVLENYTMRDSLSSALSWFDAIMPCCIPRPHRRNGLKLLPIVLPRYEFDCTKPFQQLYCSFVMALNSHCPEVCPEIRNEVVLLYESWIHSDAEERQWLSLGNVIKCLNEGVPVTKVHHDVNVSALRQLDPLTLNKLTIHALYRLYRVLLMWR